VRDDGVMDSVSPLSSEFAVGDPTRSLHGRAVTASLSLGAVFLAYAFVAKEIPTLYGLEPWKSDPYDALVSFLFVGIPVLVAPSLVRLVLCRRYQPLAKRRLIDLARVSRVLFMLVAVTIGSEWYAVVTTSAPIVWTTAAVGLAIALTILTGGAVVVGRILRQARRAPLHDADVSRQPDWFADALTAVEKGSVHLGRHRVRVLAIVQWADAHVVALVRRRSLGAAAAVTTAVGIVTISQDLHRA
jgi:hypothetical protein